MRITDHQISRSFSQSAVRNGLVYFLDDCVDDIEFGSDFDAMATVEGSRNKPYIVSLYLVKIGSDYSIVTTCTCPVGTQCKHGSALAHAISAMGNVDVGEPEPAQKELDFRVAELQPEAARITVPSDVKEWLAKVREAASDPGAQDPAHKKRVRYRLETEPQTGGVVTPVVIPITCGLGKSGDFNWSGSEIQPSSIGAYQKPEYWTAFDRRMLADLNANGTARYGRGGGFKLLGRQGARLLSDLIDSGKLFTASVGVIVQGRPKKVEFSWVPSSANGFYEPRVRAELAMVLDTAPPWYLSLTGRECAPLELDEPAELLMAMVRKGPIAAEHLAAVQAELSTMGVPDNLLPAVPIEIEVRCPRPVPFLKVEFEVCKPTSWYNAVRQAAVAFANLSFQYEGHWGSTDGADIRVAGPGTLTILRRNRPAENRAAAMLQEIGWRPATSTAFDLPSKRRTSLCVAPGSYDSPVAALEWVKHFADTVVPKLTEAGWEVRLEQDFSYVPASAVEWEVELDSPSGVDWFECKLGISVEGRPFDLRTLLNHIEKTSGGLPRLLSTVDSGQPDELFVFGLAGRGFTISRKRLAAILEPLIELFGGVSEWPEELKLSRALAPATDRLQESVIGAGVAWKSTDELTELRAKFASFDRLEPLAEPEGFVGELREYQREGLAWLQFLREYGFGGILADDMGLGKTVQIIAHMLMEKAAGRKDRPCLIVAPTSTLPNWTRELARFAPDLKVVNLRGSDRATRFDAVGEADVALTTYPLLARDHTKLAKHDYHLLVLDEAQNIKNPVTAGAKAARSLSARHRVCMSGTPVENHLGELWSLFHFSMPGFLGSDADFKKRFRNPIEKQFNEAAQAQLAKRIRPFMLRRTKSEVAKELPPKTEIVERVEFEDSQRDLYESIRSTMDERVRALIASQGLDRSRIQILDALLKLRQVCCDPRLVKLPSAKAVTESAKLARVTEMLSVLLEDGRKILLFSQFTSMLDLVEERLREAGIQWVRISGDTEDRDTPVRRFQAGEVSLFLISLKAGGTGLNLTAADTVILYDPWWNPAVENQAIDRAHRIGQDKPVIVYKMVASATIEEKMLEMQARKGDLAKNILSDEDSFHALTADDLQWVLAR